MVAFYQNQTSLFDPERQEILAILNFPAQTSVIQENRGKDLGITQNVRNETGFIRLMGSVGGRGPDGRGETVFPEESRNRTAPYTHGFGLPSGCLFDGPCQGHNDRGIEWRWFGCFLALDGLPSDLQASIVSYSIGHFPA